MFCSETLKKKRDEFVARLKIEFLVTFKKTGFVVRLEQKQEFVARLEQNTSFEQDLNKKKGVCGKTRTKHKFVVRLEQKGEHGVIVRLFVLLPHVDSFLCWKVSGC